MRIYTISSNLYSNSCQSDDPEELAKYITDVLKKAPNKALFTVTVGEMPDTLWNDLPKFEGFKLKGEIENDNSD